VNMRDSFGKSLTGGDNVNVNLIKDLNMSSTSLNLNCGMAVKKFRLTDDKAVVDYRIIWSKNFLSTEFLKKSLQVIKEILTSN
jgi:uncharacterized Zn ribbon protein